MRSGLASIGGRSLIKSPATRNQQMGPRGDRQRPTAINSPRGHFRGLPSRVGRPDRRRSRAKGAHDATSRSRARRHTIPDTRAASDGEETPSLAVTFDDDSAEDEEPRDRRRHLTVPMIAAPARAAMIVEQPYAHSIGDRPRYGHRNRGGALRRPHGLKGPLVAHRPSRATSVAGRRSPPHHRDGRGDHGPQEPQPRMSLRGAPGHG